MLLKFRPIPSFNVLSYRGRVSPILRASYFRATAAYEKSHESYFTSHDYKWLENLRHRLHKYPEISGEERTTAATICDALEPFCPTMKVTNLGGHGVAAVFDSGKPGASVLFRAELDALPIQEVNLFSYKSCSDGVSHKCGHDGHMTCLVGLAEHLSRYPPVRGKVVLLFQPAEEVGSGAKAVLDDPTFADRVGDLDWVFAFHNLPGYPLGQIILKNGPITASVRSMIIELEGKTSHAAEPEHGINPADAIAQLISGLNILSNNTATRRDFRVITPVHISMGEVAYGVSAGYGELHLTIRTWAEQEMESLISDIDRLILRALSATPGLTHKIRWTDTFVANENNDQAVKVVAQAASSEHFDLHFSDHPMKWGEDFGAFTQRYPGAFYCIGSGESHPALHNPDYDFPDKVLGVGVRMFTRIVHHPLLDLY